jgi:hypothetical protein
MLDILLFGIISNQMYADTHTGEVRYLWQYYEVLGFLVKYKIRPIQQLYLTVCQRFYGPN